MTLLNKRSLRKHLDNILSDKYLLYNDIKSLTEAQVEVRENTVDLKLKLEKHFTVHSPAISKNTEVLVLFTQSEYSWLIVQTMTV